MVTIANPWRHPPGVPCCEPPRCEGTFFLPGGRRLGYAEFGDPSGPVVLWFHGTPGGRRQLPIVGRRAAEKLGLRVVLVERAGSGLSDAHRYEQIGDWANDMAHVADLLGAERSVSSGCPAAGRTHWPAPGCLRCGTGWPPSPSSAVSRRRSARTPPPAARSCWLGGWPR